jgi:Carboxypeptidase regulatory-like domain/TonB dependent receptor
VRLLLIAIASWCAVAQSGPEALSVSGTVSDPTGAPIPEVDVALLRDGSPARAAFTDSGGSFRLSGIGAGRYEILARRDGFAPARLPVAIADHSPTPVHITLQLTGVRQEVTVTGTAEEVSTHPADNLDTVTLDRDLLNNLPIYDQDYVAMMSQFLDPGSVATGGVTLVVNGMEQRNIGVSASAIQQVKINQNPYAADFSRPGRGRIEILTKPASQEYHGTLNVLFRDQVFNARDAFALTRPATQRRIFEGSLLGPLGGSKRNSFLISVDRRETDSEEVVFAQTLAGPDRQNVPNPQRSSEVSAGITHQFSDTHLALWRGRYFHDFEGNSGVGGTVLPEAGMNTSDTEIEAFYNDSYALTPKVVNQFRLILGRELHSTASVTDAPAIVVPGSFTSGGAQADRLQTEVHGIMNDTLSWSRGRHEVRLGINVPDVSRRGLNDRTNIAGAYTFSALDDYAAKHPFSFIQQGGIHNMNFVEVVLGGFVQDEIRLSPSVQVSAGVRYDWQNYFHDNNNVSPRLAVAWAPGKKRKTVFRAGSGLFYDRTGPGAIFDLIRYGGTHLRQIVLTNPAYPAVVDPNLPISITRLDPTVHIPYSAQFSAAAERQLAKGTTLTVTYWAMRGVSLFRSRDVNAPPPPNYPLARPNPAYGVYRQIESSGHLESDALEVTFRGSLTRRFNGMVQYTLGRAYNDVPGNYSTSTRGSGINAFPANNYDLSGEWARADYDQRHRLSFLGTLHGARYADFGVGLSANTGAPYTETTGRDDYHAGYANARPLGVPRNSLQGPGYLNLDLRWFHNFRFGKKKESPQGAVSVDAFNALNHVNYNTYIGNLSSPFFGEAVSAKPPRRMQLAFKVEF